MVSTLLPQRLRLIPECNILTYPVTYVDAVTHTKKCNQFFSGVSPLHVRAICNPLIEFLSRAYNVLRRTLFMQCNLYYVHVFIFLRDLFIIARYTQLRRKGVHL